MSTAPKLVITHRASTGPIDTPWGARLRQIEERIADGESASIKARWESGRQLIEKRNGKLLPKGLLDEASKALGVSRSELSKRMKLFEKFPSDAQLRNAITKFPSWYSIVKDGLSEKRAAPYLPAATGGEIDRPHWTKKWQKCSTPDQKGEGLFATVNSVFSAMEDIETTLDSSYELSDLRGTPAEMRADARVVIEQARRLIRRFDRALRSAPLTPATPAPTDPAPSEHFKKRLRDLLGPDGA